MAVREGEEAGHRKAYLPYPLTPVAALVAVNKPVTVAVADSSPRSQDTLMVAAQGPEEAQGGHPSEAVYTLVPAVVPS
jgi:hypothetical protein